MKMVLVGMGLRRSLKACGVCGSFLLGGQLAVVNFGMTLP